MVLMSVGDSGSLPSGMREPSPAPGPVSLTMMKLLPGCRGCTRSRPAALAAGLSGATLTRLSYDAPDERSEIRSVTGHCDSRRRGSCDRRCCAGSDRTLRPDPAAADRRRHRRTGRPPRTAPSNWSGTRDDGANGPSDFPRACDAAYSPLAPLTRIDWTPPLVNFLPVTSA